MIIKFLLLLMLPLVGMGQTNANGEMPLGGNTSSEKQPLEIKRNTQYNLEEIKVRWKKAALENCTGIPCVTTPVFTCGTSTISDIDNNAYNTVLIGTQCWTKSNLKVTKYNDGSLIGDSTNSTWGTAMIGARTEYLGSVPLSGYLGTYGYLYNWYAATDSRKLCPDGWHVPTDAEWTIMIQALDPSQVENNFSGIQSTTAGTLMKENSMLWSTPGTNTSGFSALPGGYRHQTGSFNSIGTNALFWCATANSTFPGKAWSRYLYNNGQLDRGTGDLYSFGASVRCLRD